jgi:multicomponent Na+:H+ antiporter subunit E
MTIDGPIPEEQMKERLTRRLAALLVMRFALFAVLWWMLTEGAVDSWTIGFPAVVLATVSSIALLPMSSVAWLSLVRFVPFFLMRSALGGVDVARRTLQPKMPIAPALIDYPLHLPPGLPQVVMINTVSLLPGTLSADVHDNYARLHVLDKRVNYRAEIAAVERHVARLFGVPPAS